MEGYPVIRPEPGDQVHPCLAREVVILAGSNIPSRTGSRRLALRNDKLKEFFNNRELVG